MATGPIKQVTNNSDNGYCKMPDGTLICWDTSSKSGSDRTIPFTFPISFLYIPTVVVSTGAGSERTPIYVEDVSTTGFNIYRPGSGTGSIWIRWIAIGRWK